MTIVERAIMLLDRPYIWGGDGTASKFYGYDCSGLVLECLWVAGLYDGGDTTAEGLRQWCVDKAKYIRRKEVPPAGALLFFGKNSTATHVAIAIGNGLMIEAGGGGSKCKTLETSTGAVRIRPISMRKDFMEAFVL